jgi:hypothetical protein
MLHLADTAGIPDVRSRRSFFRYEIVRQGQPPEMKVEFTLDLSRSEMCAASGQFLGMRFGHIFPPAFLNSCSVAAFRDPNSDSRNGACFATSWHEREIIVPEAPHSHAAFLNIRRNSSSEGERFMKDTVHPNVHFPVHRRIFGRVRSRRSCGCDDDPFGRGQNTGLGWSDPTFVHVSVPKIIRGVAQAQLRRDRAEYFVRAAFHSREPQ